MKYLLDTHILFWSMNDEEKLPEDVLALINDQRNEIYFSSASVWEIVIKHRKNPQIMPVSGRDFLNACLESGFTPLPIDNSHVLTVDTLRRKAGEPPHSDPFDRLLIAQAKTEAMKLITHDSLLTGYAEKCVMKI